MFFKPALSLLLVPAVLGLPSTSRTRIIDRHEGRQSQVNNRLEQVVGALESDVEHSTNWAGAIWSQSGGTFVSVTGTFTVPTPSGSDGDSASAWVGIDGSSCKTAILQTGVDFTVSSNSSIYQAWYEFYPAPAKFFSGFAISAGDTVKLTVITSSSSSGTVKIDNLTRGETVFQDVHSTVALCGQDAVWIIEDYIKNGSLVPFADFGTIIFKNAEAIGSQTYTPAGATISDIEQNNQVLTSVSTDGSTITIQYV